MVLYVIFECQQKQQKPLDGMAQSLAAQELVLFSPGFCYTVAQSRDSACPRVGMARTRSREWGQQPEAGLSCEESIWDG